MGQKSIKDPQKKVPNRYAVKANGKSATGRPSKKNDIPEDQLRVLYSSGFTDQQVADFYGITSQTIDNWKKAHPEFFGALKNWKAVADHDVEKSLYQRACGWSDGEKTYPPDTTACIFWLKNRDRANWRDKVDLGHTGNVTLSITQDDAECL